MDMRLKKSQRGAATLLIAVVLLISITIVTLFTARVVLVDTKVEANNYRASQALANANANMDTAVAYFDDGGLDHNHDGVVDTISTDITFNNNDGICTTAGDMKSALITAKGTSDDGVASRTITQCVGTVDIFGGGGPKQPLISKGSVGLTGNYSIINRFTNTTGWSGGDIKIGSSATAETFTRPAGTLVTDFTKTQLEDTDTSNSYTSQPVSDRNKGNGVDTIANDPRLSNLTGDQLFNSFFFEDKTQMKALAQSQGHYYASMSAFNAANSVTPVTGLIWVDGNATINGGTIGTSDNPVVMIFGGNVKVSGNPVTHGMLYVSGQLDAAGTLENFGSVVVEGDPTLVPSGEDPVIGSGGVDLIYTPYALDENPNPLPGFTTVISGSWRDW